jgi:hypothetical protein
MKHSVRIYDPEDQAQHDGLVALHASYGYGAPKAFPLHGVVAYDNRGEVVGCWWLICTDFDYGLLENIMFRKGEYDEDTAQLMADLLETVGRQVGLARVMTFGPDHLCSRAVATRGYVQCGKNLTAISKEL